jgi:hypothetical protein
MDLNRSSERACRCIEHSCNPVIGTLLPILGPRRSIRRSIPVWARPFHARGWIECVRCLIAQRLRYRHHHRRQCVDPNGRHRFWTILDSRLLRRAGSCTDEQDGNELDHLVIRKFVGGYSYTRHLGLHHPRYPCGVDNFPIPCRQHAQVPTEFSKAGLLRRFDFGPRYCGWHNPFRKAFRVEPDASILSFHRRWHLRVIDRYGHVPRRLR